MKRVAAAIVFIFLSRLSLAADLPVDEAIDYKLSYSYFHTKTLHANDLNLRAGKNDQSFWIAGYQENLSDFNQIRIGYERVDRFAYLKLISSLQIASHGFIGGSINAEIGAPFYALVGYGRTNLKPYSNINFDPNDSITLGAGWHVDKDFNIALYGVQDNRVVDRQRITHLMATKLLLEDQKLVLDIFNKSGPPDIQGQSIHALGASVTYDINRYFMRLAYDPKVNFTQDNMMRVSLGMHF
jgi:hypothetical protein